MYYHAGSSERPAAMLKYNNDIIFKSAQASGTKTLSGVFTNLNSNWMMFGLSMGWLGDTNHNDHII